MNGENQGRVVVALPASNDPVHKIGPEDKHMTVVWLGTPEDNPGLDMDQVRGQVANVAQKYGPLTGQVNSVGQLGDDNAHVLFLKGDGMGECRDELLNQPHIKDGHQAVKQYPQWTPHVTLGYPVDMKPNAVPDENQAPDEVTFDRLGVWDGDQHDEYPLEGTGADELVAALVDAMTKPIVLKGPESLLDAIKQCDSACGTAQLATRPILMKRARELGIQHLIPLDWTRPSKLMQVATAARELASSPNVSDVSTFEAKGRGSGLNVSALQAAYMRGVREYTMTATTSRPPLSRDQVAQARVNSLIRLAHGDPSARLDDRDLLP